MTNENLDDDLDKTNEEDETCVTKNNVVLSKHSMKDVHRLKEDVIFKGKRETQITEDDLNGTAMYYNDSYEVDKSSQYWTESMDNENYIRNKDLKTKIYDILKTKTQLDFTANRRKPSREDFNKYYKLLKDELKDDNFSNVEVFIELAHYFSDNLFNMFRLLNVNWKQSILNELDAYKGKVNNSNEVTNRNIYKGTEVEFEVWNSDNTAIIDTKMGIVNEPYYAESEFLVICEKKEFYVKIEDIIRIINNPKQKQNLSSLYDVDFL